MIFFFGGIPLAVFLVFALLPGGRVAAVGIAGAVALALAARATVAQDEIGEYYRVLIGVILAGLGMAALAQAARMALPADGPRWAYALVILAVAGLALIGGRLALGGF